MKVSKPAKIGIVLAIAAVVVISISIGVAVNQPATSFNKEGVTVLATKYGGHTVVRTDNAPLITYNKQPVFNETLLDFNAIPQQIKFTFHLQVFEGAIFEFNKVQYDEARLSKELGDLPLYENGKSVIFYQWNPSGPQAGNQFLFKNAADGLWYLNRWPQYIGVIDEYLNVLGGIAA